MRPNEKPADLSPEDVVNAYLKKRFEVSLEDVITAAVAGYICPDLSSVIEATSSHLARWQDEDGAVADLFGGFLTVYGMRYAWRASMFTDVDGKRFLTDLMEFRPVDWAVAVKVVR